MCKSADLLLMVLDATKPFYHKEILTRELESVGIRLNRTPPHVYFKKRKTGGMSINRWASEGDGSGSRRRAPIPA